MFLTRSCLLISLCLVAAVPIAAQYRFDHWTTDNGLPQNSVRDIVQTRDGYLWLTTFDGLVRFDGVRFTVFNKSNSPGIASNRFLNLFEDRQGDLWAMLDTDEIVRRHHGSFTTYADVLELPLGAMRALGDDGHGNVVIYYSQLELDKRRTTFISVTVRAYRWSVDRFQPANELSVTFSLPPLLSNEASRIASGELVDGDYWITTNQRAIRFLKGGGYRVYNEQNGLPGTQPTLIWTKQRPWKVVTRDAAGRLWLSELESGQSELLSQYTPVGLNIDRAFADSEGNYWFSTYDNGLFRARPQVVTPYGKAQGLSFSEIYPLLESRDGALWIGSYRDGLFRLRNGVFTQYPAAKTNFESFNGYVFSLYEDRRGQLWISGRWRLVDGRFVPGPWANALRYPKSLFVFTMCEDHAGTYWFGTEGGVFRYQNSAATHFTTKDGLAGNDTRVIIEDGHGGLWLGSYGGLTHYKDGRFTAWTEKDGLPSNAIRALKLDVDDTLWIGTYDGGLGRFKDGTFTRYNTNDGLFDNGVFQILEDDFGWFWMNSNRGIYRVRKQELEDFAAGRIKAINSLAYNKSDGMPSTEGNGGHWPAGVKTRDGKLWFPTMGGVAMIDPARIKTNTNPPPVIIEEMRINNQPVSHESWDSTTKNPIQVFPGQDNFEIAYTALSFINSENMRFKYKLEGADHDWIDAGTRRTAYFSHLAPGNYTFRVIASNADGVWNEAGASLRITIVPPFWRTWWFLTLIALAFAGVIIAAWKYRMLQVRRVQLAQQNFARQLIASQEQERKRIAAELHDSLGQNLLIVKNRAQLGQLAAHNTPEFLEQFEWIISSATQSIEEVREIAQNLRPYHLDRLGLTKALEVMIEKVATTTRMRFVSKLVPLDDLFDKEDAITLYRVVQESLNNIIKHANAGEVRITVERLTDSVTLTVQDNGRGFSSMDAATKPSGFGLAGMAERVRMLGGEWRIDSKDGQGTTVTIRLALPVTTRGKHNGR